MADTNTPEAFTPKPFNYSPTQGQSTGMTNDPPVSQYSARMMPVPGVVYGSVPNVTPGVTIIPSEIVPTLAPGQSKQ